MSESQDRAAAELERLGAGLRRGKKGHVLVADLRPCADVAGDEALAWLGQLATVREAYLAGTRVSDTGLAQLAPLSKLETLDLQGTAITDAGLANLPAFEHLKLLLLNSTQVTREGVRQLRQSRIGTRIVCGF